MSEDHLKWPYLKTYFEQQLSTSDTTEKKSNFTFKCMLYMPKIKLISTSISSNSNLKAHIKHVHPSELITFNELGKRKSYNNNNCTQPKKQLKLSEVGKTVKKS
ncbi:unnamed protein product [Macrosiphum euphorbiae]|uniref:BED-type domain-containing protein n=1 Tax=Macrosiphum euphorbiae TaxID=13131 RepID=A0AAV0X772_9HEMI|nr:unnamed protein product [Macrosiphum euphorbiae]